MYITEGNAVEIQAARACATQGGPVKVVGTSGADDTVLDRPAVKDAPRSRPSQHDQHHGGLGVGRVAMSDMNHDRMWAKR